MRAAVRFRHNSRCWVNALRSSCSSRSGYTQQRASLIEQQRLIGEELEGLKKIAEKGFASMNRVRELERQEAELKGQQGSMEAEYARAGEGIGETKMQSLSVAATGWNRSNRP